MNSVSMLKNTFASLTVLLEFITKCKKLFCNNFAIIFSVYILIDLFLNLAIFPGFSFYYRLKNTI